LKSRVVKGHKKYLEDCKEAVLHSKLGQVYFDAETNLLSDLANGMENEELFVAVGDDGACQGFIWFVLKGAFHSFPYLHIIAVKEAFRCQGIGKQLLDFFEETVFVDSSKIFLVVADFNPEAKQLFESLGYKQVGEISGLYKDGVTEYLMMKRKDGR